jgi:hypothetical protein
MMKIGRINWRELRLLAVMVGLSLLWGCQPDILAPQEPDSEEAFSEAGRPFPVGSSAWYEVASELVEPGKNQKVKGSRYTLEFDGDELTEPTLITIREWNPDVVDFDVKPDGLILQQPATLRIGYHGTANEPSSPDYAGVPPAVYRYSAGGGKWVPLPGSDHPGQSPFYTVEVSHFSRYAMWDGTGGSLVFGHPTRGKQLKLKAPHPSIREGTD